MDPLITNLAREYVKKLQTEGAALDFVEFKMDPNQQSIGMHSEGVSGQVIYHRAEDKLCMSEMVFVKYYVPSGPQFHKYDLHSMFHNEIHFYTRVVPFLATLRSIHHLLPQFLDHLAEGPGVAIMFRHLGPRWTCNNYRSLLDYAHLRLMVRKLGEFHAYSFAARSRAEAQFQQLSTFSPGRQQSVVDAVQADMKQTLAGCVQSLSRDKLYADAVPRLQTLLVHRLADFMLQSYTVSPEDPSYVLSHLSFNQSNVMFSYANRRPVDMKIMDWQTISFTSMGVDLLGLLYMDTCQQTRAQYWDQLLDDYHDALTTTFATNTVPSREQLCQELRKGVGAVIFVMTYRATSALLKDGSKLKSQTIRNRELLTEMLKDMVDRGLL